MLTTPAITASVTSTGASIEPTADVIVARAPVVKPRGAASSGWICSTQRSRPLAKVGMLCCHELFERR